MIIIATRNLQSDEPARMMLDAAKRKREDMEQQAGEPIKSQPPNFVFQLPKPNKMQATNNRDHKGTQGVPMETSQAGIPQARVPAQPSEAPQQSPLNHLPLPWKQFLSSILHKSPEGSTPK